MFSEEALLPGCVVDQNGLLNAGAFNELVDGHRLSVKVALHTITAQ